MNLHGILGLWNGVLTNPTRLRFAVQPNSIEVSVYSENNEYSSPYSASDFKFNVQYPSSVRDGKIHYWVWSIDCTEVYNASITSELEGYKGDFYSSKIFVDGELLYDTYYSKQQYDYLKNSQNSWHLKYFTIGRCTRYTNNWWHYAKMKTYCMRLYNRGLSEGEIIDNYNKTKAYYSAVIAN